MNALLINAADLEHLPDLARPISCVGLFDDSSAKAQAIEIHSRVFNILRAEFQFECDWWSFEQLGQARLADEAATIAARADMVLFAVANADDLPRKIKLWIEMWLAKRTSQDGALIAIAGVANTPKSATGVQTYLEKIAREVGLAYFTSQFKCSEPVAICSMEGILARATTVTPLLEKILLHRPPPALK